MEVVAGLILVVAFFLTIPALVFFVECVVAAMPRRAPRTADASGPRPRTAVLVPAHDEEAGIEGTVRALRSQLGPEDRLLVIADNCSDRTASIAREAGAEVLERADADKRGKGYALSFGAEKLEASPPEVVVIVDADCRLSSGGLEALAREAKRTDRPIQADYLLEAPKSDDVRSLISGLALLVKNRVRPEGLRRLGMPAHLTGSGMAFPWEVYRKAPATESWLVEDLLMGLELALLGHPPLYLPEVKVNSELPEGAGAALKQRRRWEHGALATMRTHAPKLLATGVTRARPELVVLALDVSVPPLALLVMVLALFAAATAGFGVISGDWRPLGAALTPLIFVASGVMSAWWAYGRGVIPLSKLLLAPLYVAWKVPLYVAYALRGQHKSWERTERKR